MLTTISNAVTVSDLQSQQRDLRQRLSAAILNGSPDEILGLQNQLVVLPDQILAASIKEHRQHLAKLEVDIKNQEQRIKTLQAILADRNRELEEQLDRLEPMKLACTRASFAIGTANIQLSTLLEQRRTAQQELKSVIEQVHSKTDTNKETE